MRLLHSRNSWHYSQGSNPTVDFCLWVLQVDGLHVPPFDQHPDGDGSLRTLGLTEEAWQTWFLRALDPVQSKQDMEQLRQQHLAAYLQSTGLDMEQLGQRHRAEQLKISTDPPLPPPPEWYHYHASWQGGIAIKNKLIELEKQYQQIADQRDRLRDRVERELHREERKVATRLYDELKPYHNKIPPLNICLAVYEYPLDYLVAPAAFLLTVQEGQPRFQEFRERVIAAVAELAAHSDRRRKQSAYTRRETSAGQFIAYRRHTRKPIPPPLPRPAIPRLDDPLKQMVLEELGAERMFHPTVDFATLQFLREKQKPGWRLYEVAFQDIDGEQHRTIFILQKKEDNSWLLNGGGTSSDMQNQWSKIFVPVHDHPLIFLTWQGMNFDDQQQYLQTAHGDVIDNGFQVERVRLANDAGQVLEDKVEDGYVFFACKPEEQVQLPMQAELYDRQGKLVWRQKFPDQGLPPWLKLKYKR